MTKMNWDRAAREHRLAQGQGYWDRRDEADEAWFEREKAREAAIEERRALRRQERERPSQRQSAPKGDRTPKPTKLLSKNARKKQRRQAEAKRLGITEEELRARRRAEHERTRAAKVLKRQDQVRRGRAEEPRASPAARKPAAGAAASRRTPAAKAVRKARHDRAASKSSVCRHRMKEGHCPLCAGRVVYVTGGGQKFHVTPKCEALLAGQEKVRERGHTPDPILPVTARSERLAFRDPCLVCCR